MFFSLCAQPWILCVLYKIRKLLKIKRSLRGEDIMVHWNIFFYFDTVLIRLVVTIERIPFGMCTTLSPEIFTTVLREDIQVHILITLFYNFSTIVSEIDIRQFNLEISLISTFICISISKGNMCSLTFSLRQKVSIADKVGTEKISLQWNKTNRKYDLPTKLFDLAVQF